MVFFTDFNGDMLSSSSKDTAKEIYPGPKVNAEGYVYADYNPNSDRFLLCWNRTNHQKVEKQTSRENFYRMMDSSGKFKSGKKKIPQSTDFQTNAFVTYNSVEDRFFVIYPEYKVLCEKNEALASAVDEGKFFWGGKLWGLYINNKGKIVDKAKGFAVALTDEFKNTDEYFSLTSEIHDPILVHNSSGNEFFIPYHLSSLVKQGWHIWGLIYK